MTIFGACRSGEACCGAALGSLLLLLGACSTYDVLGSLPTSKAARPESSAGGAGGFGAVDSSSEDTAGAGSTALPGPPNVLQDRQSASLAQVNARLNKAFSQLFYGEPETEAVFFDQGDGTGYVMDIANGDVRTDAMGYGMLVTVQLDQRDVFDKLWAWTKRHMKQAEGRGAGLLSWRCDTSGENCSSTAATDACSVIATSLFIASARWGPEGAHDYLTDGRELLAALGSIEERNGGVVDGVVSCFAPATGLPRATSFSPEPEVPTDYLMPAFYRVWQSYDPERAELWRKAESGARALLQGIAHPETGLLPEWVYHEGRPLDGSTDYRSTTSRALLNLALDEIWWGPHDWIVPQNELLLDFFLSEGIDTYVQQYTYAGEPLSDFNSLAHISVVAAAAGTSADRRFDPFLEELLEAPTPTGTYRYFDGMLYMLSLLVLSGQMAPP